MINLRNKETGQLIGAITDEQFRFLTGEFEMEGSGDKDYWINRAEIEMLSEDGCDPALVTLLLNALGSGEDMEIIWEKVK